MGHRRLKPQGQKKALASRSAIRHVLLVSAACPYLLKRVKEGERRRAQTLEIISPKRAAVHDVDTWKRPRILGQLGNTFFSKVHCVEEDTEIAQLLSW